MSRPQMQYNSTTAPQSMANVPVPMDLDCARAPNRSGGYRRGGYYTNATTQDQRPRRNNNQLCFECGKPGHFARDCCQRLAKQANLAVWEDQDAMTMVPDDSISQTPFSQASTTPTVEELTTHLQALTAEDRVKLSANLAPIPDFPSA
jgi:Zinc knuckle